MKKQREATVKFQAKEEPNYSIFLPTFKIIPLHK